MKIGELSLRSGISVEAIRFYEKEGLIDPAKRLENNYRLYSTVHLEQLNFIHHCRSLDMPLADIKTLIRCDANDSEQAAGVHALIARQVKLVDERIAKLKVLRKHLLALSARCSGMHEKSPCGILVGLNEDAHEGHCHCEDRIKEGNGCLCK